MTTDLKPTPVRVGVMDSQRPGVVVDLAVHQLSSSERIVRGLKRMALVSLIGAVITPVPLIHLCGLAVLLVAGPIAGVFAWRDLAVIGAGQNVTCPKCSEQVTIGPKQAGWPARVHCGKCGAMVELNPA